MVIYDILFILQFQVSTSLLRWVVISIDAYAAVFLCAAVFSVNKDLYNCIGIFDFNR